MFHALNNLRYTNSIFQLSDARVLLNSVNARVCITIIKLALILSNDFH